jgi:hypothetical protein
MPRAKKIFPPAIWTVRNLFTKLWHRRLLSAPFVTTAWRTLKLLMERKITDIEGNCKCIEQAVADSRQWVILQLGDWARGWKLAVKLACYEKSHRASDLDGFITDITYLAPRDKRYDSSVVIRKWRDCASSKKLSRHSIRGEKWKLVERTDSGFHWPICIGLAGRTFVWCEHFQCSCAINKTAYTFQNTRTLNWITVIRWVVCYHGVLR